MTPSPQRAQDPRRFLRHHDPSQLWFQIAEVYNQRVYLRHGIKLDPACTVLDVGANVGVAATFFATRCGAAAVHSFEPVGPLYELLVENVSRFDACTTHSYGLSDRAGEAEITYYPGAGAMSGLHADPDRDRELVRSFMINYGMSMREADKQLEGRYEPQLLRCRLRTLSEVLAELALGHVDLLKVDVEGSELEVLEGIGSEGWATIRQAVIEVTDVDGRLRLVEELLRRRGFDVTLDQDRNWRGTPLWMAYARR